MVPKRLYDELLAHNMQLKKQHKEYIYELNLNHQEELEALRRKHKQDMEKMVPKKWYDDALRLIEDLKKQLAAFKSGMDMYVERHTYE